jgi:hypothetical protein
VRGRTRRREPDLGQCSGMTPEHLKSVRILRCWPHVIVRRFREIRLSGLPEARSEEPNMRRAFASAVVVMLLLAGCGGGSKATSSVSSMSVSHPGLSAIYDLTIDPRHPQTVYATFTADPVYKSTDGGKSWVDVKPSTRGTPGLTEGSRSTRTIQTPPISPLATASSRAQTEGRTGAVLVSGART